MTPDEEGALIPRDDVSGRALKAVVAILTFLACLCAGGGVWLASTSAAWQEDLGREIAIQIRPHSGADVQAEVAAVVAAASRSPVAQAVKALSVEETQASLAPWLGAGLDLKQLPIPRLVTVTLASRGASELAALRAAVAKAAPDAVFDDNSVWRAHLTSVGRALTWLAWGLLMLVVAAIAVAIGFATRAAMAEAREIVEVLHFVGASDTFIVQQFQRYFLRLTAQGAAMGAGAAAVLFLIADGATAGAANTAEGRAMQVLVGGFHLPLIGYGAILVVAAALMGIAGVFSAFVASAHLRSVN